MQCVILAGGLGTRIASVRSDIPKALIPVAGRPFAFHQLEWLAKQGATDVIYCIGHKGEMIEEAVGDGISFGIRVRYCDEGSVLRGTGGALRLAYDQNLLREAFFVLYADSYLPIEIQPVWHASVEAHEPTMVVIRNDGLWDASNVIYRDGRVERYEKGVADPLAAGMRFTDYGLSVLKSATVAARIPANTRYDLADLYTSLSGEGLLRGYEVTQRFYEIGSPAGLQALEARLGSCVPA